MNFGEVDCDVDPAIAIRLGKVCSSDQKSKFLRDSVWSSEGDSTLNQLKSRRTICGIAGRNWKSRTVRHRFARKANHNAEDV